MNRPLIIARRKLATELHLPKPEWADGEEIDDTAQAFHDNLTALRRYVRDTAPMPIHLRMVDWADTTDWRLVEKLYRPGVKIILTPGEMGEMWNIPGADNLYDAGKRIVETLVACMEWVPCPAEDIIVMVGIPVNFPFTRPAPALFTWHFVSMLIALGVNVQVNNWGKPGKFEAYDQWWAEGFDPEDLWGTTIEYAALMDAKPKRRILEPCQGWMQNHVAVLHPDGTVRKGDDDGGAHFRGMCIHARDVIKPVAIAIYRYMPQAEHVAAILDEVWPK